MGLEVDTLSPFEKRENEMREAMLAGRVSEAIDKSIVAYGEGVKDLILLPGKYRVSRLMTGLILGIGAPIGLPFLMLTTGLGATISRIGIGESNSPK